MRNAGIGLVLGVLLTSAVWWSMSILRTPTRATADPAPAARLPPEYDDTHDVDALDPRARRSIRAFKAIAHTLAEGELSGVREHALAIAEFFAPMNAKIEASALRLSNANDLESAKSRFRELTEAFQHPPIEAPDAYEL